MDILNDKWQWSLVDFVPPLHSRIDQLELASSGSATWIAHDSKTHSEIFMISCQFFSFLAAPLIKGQFASAPKFQRWA